MVERNHLDTSCNGNQHLAIATSKVHIRWPYNYLLRAPMTETSTHGLEPLERGKALVLDNSVIVGGKCYIFCFSLLPWDSGGCFIGRAVLLETIRYPKLAALFHLPFVISD